MRSQTRSMTVALAVVVLLIVAIWPRDDTSAGGERVWSGRSAPSSPAPLTQQNTGAARDPGSVGQCPTAAGSVGSGPLAGVELVCLGGSAPTDVAAALSSEPTLINLWASWCAPCREEMPVLDRYARESGAIRVVGINVQDREAAALALMSELGVQYPSYGDGDAVLAALEAPAVLPQSYVLTPGGAVQRVTDPLVFDDPDQIRDAVHRLLS